VSWQNDDEEAHRIRASDSTWESTTLVHGAGFDLTFKYPGVYNYTCTIHPAMRGTVVVELPILALSNASSVARGMSFQAGDSWTLQVTNAAPLQSVYLGTTDSSGLFSMSGSFTAADAANWQEQVVIGSPTADERSAGTISFSVK
ncbi:MAG: hypothetical protein DMG07_21970, partial [Acidobacteria bacterium]